MPFLVPNVLLLAVPLDGGRVLLAIPPPIVRITGTPFLRAVQAHLAVFRVRRDLLAVILSAAAALAAGVAAHRLSRLIFRWLEDPLTVPASPFDHTGGCRILRSAMVRRKI
jgi:Zn-dependent protease